MDFWSRLVRGAKPSKKPIDPNSPQVRLASLKRAYNNLLRIWHNGDVNTVDSYIAENARICLRRLAELLGADQRGPTPHPCVSFAATSRLLVTVARLSTVLNNDGVTYEALGICSLLIDSEEEAFLEDRAFADTLPDFTESVQRCSRSMEDSNMESSLLELLFGLAAKLRVEPHVLRVWFRPEKPEEDGEDLSDSERRTRFEEFPLFYLLLSYIASEGRAGEFARMGMLYIVDLSVKSQDLERWIVQGDMAALMASGLGALYSQLSRKLSLSYNRENPPAILKFSDRAREEPANDVEETTSPENQAHLATFLSSLVFWQDLLEHCVSNDIKQTLLDHYQFLFLQQLLYPSLLESSDVDGGSAVAVLVYLRHVLSSIDHPDLVRLTFQYLFGHEISVEEVDTIVTPVTRIRRRKSDLLFARLKSDEDSFSPDLFNLTDLIMTSLKSHNQQVATATCELLSTLLRRPHHANQPNLLRTRPAKRSTDQRTVGGQEKEVDQLLTLAENISAFQDLETSYEHHLHDNREILESHPCSIKQLNLPVASKTSSTVDSIKNERNLMRILSTNDPILKGLVALLERFFINEIETNLSLTQTIIDLASCGYLRIEGWLLTHPLKYQYLGEESSRDDEGDESMINSVVTNSIGPDSMIASVITNAGELDPSIDAQIHSVKLARRQPTWRESDVSPIHLALEKLLQEAEKFQREINDFDTGLFDCRNIIEGREIDTTLPSVHAHSPVRRSEDRHQHLTAQKNAQLPTESIKSRLKSDRTYGGDSQPATPRGRPLDVNDTPSLVNRLSHLQISPTRNSSQGSSRQLSVSPAANSKQSEPTASPRTGHFRKISAALTRRIKIPDATENLAEDDSDTLIEAEEEETGEETGGDENSSQALNAEDDDFGEEISLGQLLTNVIILQEFILELAALVEVRGTLFREVRQM